MQVGSLVVCIREIEDTNPSPSRPNGPFPVVDNLYVVSGVYDRTNCAQAVNWTYISLEELHPNDGFWVDCFREVQPPQDLTKIFEDEKVTELVAR